MAKPKNVAPVLVRTKKTCFISNNRYYAGDTFVYRSGVENLPEYLEVVEEAAEAEPAVEEVGETNPLS